MLLSHLKVSGLLSFGPKGLDLELRSLNVLIGPNGSGKSNLIEVLTLFQAAPTRLAGPVMVTGGIDEWIYKSPIVTEPQDLHIMFSAHVETVVVNQNLGATMGVRHSLQVTSNNNRLELIGETIAQEKPFRDEDEAHTYYRLSNGQAEFFDSVSISSPGIESLPNKVRTWPRSKLDPEQSILSQVKDPDRYKVFDYLQTQYAAIGLYRNWSFGPASSARLSPAADERQDRVSERGDNLALVLARLQLGSKTTVLQALYPLFDGVEDYQVVPGPGGKMQLFLQEAGGRQIPATRLSDGTLRYLFLLAILLDPKPAPLIAIEEPELGLHPDVIPKVAELLISASQRTQLIVTTHSRMLIDAFGEDPESVIVCGKENGETTMERLSADDLKEWLQRYSLGDLWSKGEIGGNRW